MLMILQNYIVIFRKMRPQNTNHLKTPGHSSKRSILFQSHEISLGNSSLLWNSGLCQYYLSKIQDPSLDI